MIAGALVAGGIWLLFQLLFTGGALAAIDPEKVDRAHAFGIGTSAGTILAPLIAMFVGGAVAGRLAGHYERRVAGFHGVLVWAIASVVGVALLANVASNIASSHMVAAHDESFAPPPPGAGQMVDQSLASVNAKLKADRAPTISKGQFLDASRVSLSTSPTGAPTYDREAFIRRLEQKTKMSRPEAEAALAALGNNAPNVLLAASQVAAHREASLRAAEDAGGTMLAAGVGLLLCLASALAGSLLFTRRRARGDGGGVVTEPAPAHTTAPFPSVATPEVHGNEL
ncbi:MAG: hypothetical protein HOV81_01370 [Kofleriaceae bacterium]|nr:hypothetical protein [Kofleriaceae bacterium]